MQFSDETIDRKLPFQSQVNNHSLSSIVIVLPRKQKNDGEKRAKLPLRVRCVSTLG